MAIIRSPSASWRTSHEHSHDQTHILPTQIGGVDWDELSGIEVRDGDPQFVENVFQEAEAMGFKTGDNIWIDWRWDAGQMGNEGMWEIRPYWEYAGVNKEVSVALSALSPAAGATGTKEGG